MWSYATTRMAIITGLLVGLGQYANKLVVDVARDAQCCVHTRDSSCRGQTHKWTDGQMDGQTLCDNKG